MADQPQLPKLTAVANPLNLVPVILKEAALDSPTFRATSIHFGDQIDAVERWLDAYIKAASRLANEVTSIENLVSNYLNCAAPPQAISEAAIDHDYTVLALTRYNDGAREFWTATIKWMKKVESTVVDPIKSFIHNEISPLKSMRRTLDLAQRNFDSTVARYASQSKTKETSSLREDAFQLHEARKAYLKASMDFCVAAPQVRASLDNLLVTIFSNRWREMKNSRDALSSSFTKWSTDMDRVRGWSREMENHERVFAQELQLARRQIEDAAEQKTRPSRDLDSYSSSTTPYMSNSAGPLGSPTKLPTDSSEKQGWLFQKTLVGKPSRTVWTRRWFYVKNGIFGWLAQSSKFASVEESDKIGVLLCGVRPAIQEERRFCFEVKTKDSTLILQPETEAGLMQWIAAFEVVKRRALDNPAGGGEVGMSSSQGAPFAITPPIAPEFAARVADVHLEEGVERASTSAAESSIVSRSTTDVRKGGLTERDPESKTERFKQKLSGSQSANSNNAPGLGGIASLIAASHHAMPISPHGQASPATTKQSDFRRLFSTNIPNSTLAPSTLANPPAPTTLSKAAIIVGAEQGLTLSQAGDGGLPSGLMANLWGSTNWGHVNRLEKASLLRSEQVTPSLTSTRSPSPSRRADQTNVSKINVKDAPQDLAQLEQIQSAPAATQTLHRKTASKSNESPALKIIMSDDYPNYYPASLKAQDVQFRVLFPHAGPEEKLVLVFRATWNPSDQQEFPGRLYVTPKEIFFYSNHLGLVLITGVRLDSIAEITAAPGKDCDFLFVHLKEGITADGTTRIAVKIFLEPLNVLRRRLDFLVHNAQSERPIELEEIIKSLIKMELSDGDESPIMDSWEDISAEVGMDNVITRRAQDVKTSLHIDGSLYSDPMKRLHKNATKFRLPAHPVEFVPQGFKNPIVEKQFEVTAKSLFHVLAGDKSAVFEILYCQRGATKLLQGPWVVPDEGHHRREVRYEIHNSKRQFEVADYQVIDVLNDHLCYVITERKTAWFLPRANYFTLVMKIVITHVAKSHCKLTMFGRVEWSKTPLFGKGLIDHQANAYLYSYATSLLEIVSDQAARLGIQGSTSARKAINVFGGIGQQQQSLQLLAADLAPVDMRGAKRMRYRSLPRLVIYATRRVAITYFFMLLGWALELMKLLHRTITANKLLVLLLISSVGTNFFYSSKESWMWWQDRKAGRYMSRLGVKPNSIIARSIWLKDINQIVTNTEQNLTSLIPPGGACHASFKDLLDDVDPSMSPFVITQDSSLSQSTRSMLSRISKSRQNFGAYRHDLLVALRMIGTVEREIMTAEWENWVVNESQRCKQIQVHLKTSQRNDTVVLQTWWDKYCTSCLNTMDDLEGYSRRLK